MYVDDYIKEDKFKIIKVTYRNVEVLFLNRLDAHKAIDDLVQLYGGEVRIESVYVDGDLITYLRNNGYEVKKVN
ncbi:hypothetical protein [Macrococcus armenti]|uniref:hypothetical protein n=1 Tax=Macrococcus armenti TaxID=2875764 RepID=UPI001CCA3349|nr:hypothetical protein [Macrococcus armenti]UBH14869.1 hypothetical protein LAU44_08875 [Macrococcus armenti]UBH17229.1 hypothetical protein LAU39_08905 [Macrococcus armenti]UBH19494.1 hypothetical protein LAU40_08885 [Macrococcus armenti]